MNRVAAAFVALALSITLGVAAAPHQPDYRLVKRDTPLYSIAVIGDSYTTGGDWGGLGSQGWTTRAWQWLAKRGVQVAPDVAAEGGAGYVVPGNRGNVFEGLAARSAQPNDALVVFYGSRNDHDADPNVVAGAARSSLGVARRGAPNARLLVIGPPWPTDDVPDNVWRVRDALAAEAAAIGATFIDPLAEHWFVGRPELIGKDGIHPTDAGHAYMADKIAPLILAQLPLHV